MMRKTFHGDNRPSLLRWRAQTDRSHVERSHPQAAKTSKLLLSNYLLALKL